MNERTHFFIKIYLSHFILERVDVGCVWEMSCRRGQTATYWPKFFWPWHHFFLILAGVAQPWVTDGPKPSVCRWLSLRHLVPNWLNWLEPPRTPGYIIVWHPPASAVLLLIYTGASLDWRLDRGSICYNDRKLRMCDVYGEACFSQKMLTKHGLTIMNQFKTKIMNCKHTEAQVKKKYQWFEKKVILVAYLDMKGSITVDLEVPVV